MLFVIYHLLVQTTPDVRKELTCESLDKDLHTSDMEMNLDQVKHQCLDSHWM